MLHLNGLLLSIALGAGGLSNFPREAGGKIVHPAIAVTVGGAQALVVPAGELLTAFRADGSTPSGFPVLIAAAADEAASGPAAAADMDGDGSPEIAAATTAGRVFLWSRSVLPGFPRSLGARARAGVSFGDVDGDGRPELLVGDEAGRIHALRRNGAPAKGFPLAVGAGVTSAVSTAFLGGARVLAFGCEDGKVHVVDAAGREREGFPLATGYAVTGAPVFVDLDDDGALDLVVASQDFALYAVSATGQPLPGFPAKTGYRLYEGPAVADVDGDGKLDVAFASADGMLHVVSRAGVPLRGFPVRTGPRVFGGAAVGDLDRDGELDLVVVSADGAVHAVSRTGKPLPGFPAALGASEVVASPFLADLGHDGTLSVFVGLPGGDLHAVRATRAGSAVAAAPWPGPGRDPARSSRFGPNPPAYKELRLDPAAPTVSEALRASWRAVWLDAGPGERAPAPRIEWRRNGAAVKELEGRKELPAGTARKGERWRFVLAAPASGAADASARSGRADPSAGQSPEVLVHDSAPSVAEVAIEPSRPSRAALAAAKVTKPATDADGDALTYRIEWLLDGLPSGVTGETFPGAKMKRGVLLGARVVANDGERNGPAALAQARVGDTAPGALIVALAPAVPRRAEPIRASVATPATDVDGDPLTYGFRWTVGGEVRNLPLTAAELPPGLFAKHQKVRVEARAFDGELEGPLAVAEVTVANTPPSTPAVAILPDEPRRGEPLRAVLAAAAVDADADPLTYRFEWKKNGQPFAGAVAGGREVPASAVARGDRFEVTVVPNDGEVDGPAAVAAVAVGNTPPAPPRIAIEPRHPQGGDPLEVKVLEPARDADGDAVSLAVAWTSEGKPAGGAEQQLAPAAFRKHQRVRVTVTPRDGTDAGTAVSDEVVVDDAPPTAPVVAFGAERPTVTAPLEVVTRTPAKDADGDPLTYRYRYLRDGAPVAVGDGSEASRAPPFWTGAAKVPPSALAKGQRWEVETQAFDGERYGPVAGATVTIANSPPPAPRLALVPSKPRRVDGIAVGLQQITDADGDVLTYRFAWTRNGQRYDTAPEQFQIPRGAPRRGETWAVEVVASDGEAESQPTRLELTVADTAPGPAAVALCGGPVPSGTVPQAKLTREATDADGDGLSYRYEWTLNGRPIPAAAGQTRLAAPALRKHDVVRLVTTPWDGTLAGPPAAAECQVVNTPPGAPDVVLEPAEPVALSGLQVLVRRPSTDRDGDAVTYRYAWTRDGLPVPFTGATVPAATLRHGEVWRVEVTPYDGEEEGQRVVMTTTVRNTPPVAPGVVLVPELAGVGQELTCQVKAPQRDLDQEPIALSYRWYRDDRLVAVAEGSPRLPAGLVRRGERWRCEVGASDGFAESPRATAGITIRNSAPAAPEVVVEPEKPRRGDDLACRVAAAAVDPDGDPVAYTYAWSRNGKPVPQGADPAHVEASRIAKNERWKCTATPSDGSAAGPAGVAERTVLNTPPGPCRVRLAPASPRVRQALKCEITAGSEDADGDRVRYRYTWQRNGAAQPFAESSQEVPPRLLKVGDRWRCQVVPTDGTEDGPAAGSEEVTVLPAVDDSTASVSPGGGK